MQHAWHARGSRSIGAGHHTNAPGPPDEAARLHRAGAAGRLAAAVPVGAGGPGRVPGGRGADVGQRPHHDAARDRDVRQAHRLRAAPGAAGAAVGAAAGAVRRRDAHAAGVRALQRVGEEHHPRLGLPHPAAHPALPAAAVQGHQGGGQEEREVRHPAHRRHGPGAAPAGVQHRAADRQGRRRGQVHRPRHAVPDRDGLALAAHQRVPELLRQRLRAPAARHEQVLRPGAGPVRQGRDQGRAAAVRGPAAAGQARRGLPEPAPRDGPHRAAGPAGAVRAAAGAGRPAGADGQRGGAAGADRPRDRVPRVLHAAAALPEPGRRAAAEPRVLRVALRAAAVLLPEGPAGRAAVHAQHQELRAVRHPVPEAAQERAAEHGHAADPDQHRPRLRRAVQAAQLRHREQPVHAGDHRLPPPVPEPDAADQGEPGLPAAPAAGGPAPGRVPAAAGVQLAAPADAVPEHPRAAAADPARRRAAPRRAGDPGGRVPAGARGAAPGVQAVQQHQPLPLRGRQAGGPAAAALPGRRAARAAGRPAARRRGRPAVALPLPGVLGVHQRPGPRRPLRALPARGAGPRVPVLPARRPRRRRPARARRPALPAELLPHGHRRGVAGPGAGLPAAPRAVRGLVRRRAAGRPARRRGPGPAARPGRGAGAPPAVPAVRGGAAARAPGAAVPAQRAVRPAVQPGRVPEGVVRAHVGLLRRQHAPRGGGPQAAPADGRGAPPGRAGRAALPQGAALVSAARE